MHSQDFKWTNGCRFLRHPQLPELCDLLGAESLMRRERSGLAGDSEFMVTSGFQTQLHGAQLLSAVHSGSEV